MGFVVKPAGAPFVGEVAGLDLRALDAATVEKVMSAVTRFPVTVFPRQSLDDAHLVAFAKIFGPLDVMSTITPKAAHSHFAAAAAEIQRHLVDVTNLDENGAILSNQDARRKILDGAYAWHSDCTYRKIAASYSMLFSRITPPEGGETEFADMTAAYAALPQAMKSKIDGLQGEHSVIYSAAQYGFTEWTAEQRAELTPRVHPLVRTHPVTGRKSLVLASHLEKIVGWFFEDSRKLIDELTEFSTQPRFVYRHHWAVDELVVWDNRYTMHRASPFEADKYPRRLRSIRVMDCEPAQA